MTEQNTALKKETLKCALDALELECRHSFGGIPTDIEYKGWIVPIATNKEKLQEILGRRNKWVLTFSEKIPDFWESLFSLIREQIAK